MAASPACVGNAAGVKVLAAGFRLSPKPGVVPLDAVPFAVPFEVPFGVSFKLGTWFCSSFCFPFS